MARDEADTQSDIDILVELDHSKPIGMKFFGFQVELAELLKKKVDLVSANGISPLIKPYIDKDKILIYESRRSFQLRAYESRRSFQLRARDNFQKQDAFATIRQTQGGHFFKTVLHLKKIVLKKLMKLSTNNLSRKIN